jgi:hypothetical protein
MPPSSVPSENTEELSPLTDESGCRVISASRRSVDGVSQMSKFSTLSLRPRNPFRKQSAFHTALFSMPMTPFFFKADSIQITIKFTSASCLGLGEYPEMGPCMRNSRRFWARWAYGLSLIWKEMVRKKSRGTTWGGMNRGGQWTFLGEGRGVLHLVPCMTLAMSVLKGMAEGLDPIPHCRGRRQVFPQCGMGLFQRERRLGRRRGLCRKMASNHLRGGRPREAG